MAGGGTEGGEEEGGRDNLPLALCMRWRPNAPSRTPTLKNTRLHTTPITTDSEPESIKIKSAMAIIRNIVTV